MPARRLSRVMSTSTHHNLHKAAEEPPKPEVVIKHIRLPPLKYESPLVFELMVVLYAVLILGLQFLHLYRTVWWLPQSFNSMAINFYLIDVNLIIFVLIIVGRRIPYLIMKKFFVNPSIPKILMTIFTLGALALTTVRLYGKHNLGFVQYLYLFGPLVVSLHTLTFNKFWDIDELDKPHCEAPQGYHHVCSNDPHGIREECEKLRELFNSRIKVVLTNAFLLAYYSAFIPWCFVQPFVSYDLLFVGQHLSLSFMYLFGLLVSRGFSPEFSDSMHKVAAHLGKWTKLRPNHIQSNCWTGDYLFLPGAIVRHQRELFKAEGIVCTAAEPGNMSHSRFQQLFSGSSFSRLLLGYLVGVQLLTLLIFLKTTEWYQLISISCLLITSALTLVRLTRDFLVVWKMYQAEEMILRQ